MNNPTLPANYYITKKKKKKSGGGIVVVKKEEENNSSSGGSSKVTPTSQDSNKTTPSTTPQAQPTAPATTSTGARPITQPLARRQYGKVYDDKELVDYVTYNPNETTRYVRVGEGQYVAVSINARASSINSNKYLTYEEAKNQQAQDIKAISDRASKGNYKSQRELPQAEYTTTYDGQGYSVAPGVKEAKLQMNIKASQYRDNPFLSETKAPPRPKIYGELGENAIITKGSELGALTYKPVETLSSFLDYATPNKVRNYLYKNEIRLANKYPIKYTVTSYGVKFGANILNLAVTMKALGLGTTFKTSQSTINKRAYDNYLFKPVRIKIDNPNVKYSYKEVQVNVLQGENTLNAGKYVVVGVKEPRYAFEVNRFQRWFYDKYNKLNPINLAPKNVPDAKLDYTQLEIKYPTGKKVEVERASVGVSTTEPFIITKNNEIVSFKGKRVRIQTQLATNSRVSPTIISNVEGKMTNPLELRNINPKELPKELRGFYDKNTKVQAGEVNTIDVMKVKIKNKPFRENFYIEGLGTIKSVKPGVGGYIKLKLPGKRITRGEVYSLQKSDYLVEFDTGKIKEYEVIAGKISVKDTTFPKFRKRKSSIISGKTYRAQIEVEPPYEPSEFIQSLKIKQVPKSLITKEILKAGATLKVSQITRPKIMSKSLTLPSTTSTPRTINIQKIHESLYYGTGQYERSNELISFNYMQPIQTKSYIKTSSIVKDNTEIKPLTRDIIRLVPKENNKGLNKEVTRNIVRDVNKNINKYNQRLIPKLTPKLTQKTTQKYNITRGGTNRITTKMPPKRPAIIPKIDFKFNNIKSGGKGQKGYKTLVRRFGKWFSLKGIRTKSEALQFGEKVAKNTLVASFKVSPTRWTVKGKIGRYKPSFDIFRASKIKKGKRIPLKDTFIQRRGKRLKFLGEIKEIQYARQMKGGRK